MPKFFYRYRRRYLWLAMAMASPVLAGLLDPVSGLTGQAQSALGVFGMAVVLWVSGAVPLPVTGLLILAGLPLLGVMEPEQAFALFGNPSVFFILGAFILAAALMSTGLSRRISLFLLLRFGASARSLSVGILATCALLSCVMPEHAVAAVIFPTVSTIADALELEPRRSRLAILLYLSMAWGCVTGGIATLLGGARVPLALGILKDATDRTLEFSAWSIAAAPVAVSLAVLSGLVLQVFFPPEVRNMEPARSVLEKEVQRAGPVSRREKKAGLVALSTIAAWIFVGESVGMATIALLCAFVLFSLDVISWGEVEEWVNWGVLLMYGGAIALGSALTHSGATEWLARTILGGLPESPWVFLAATAAVTLCLTELISNAAAVAVMLPISLSVSINLNIDPIMVLFTVAVPSGLTFTLPVGSPPNAIAFSSGYYEIRDIIIPGFLMSGLSFAAFLIAAWLYWPLL